MKHLKYILTILFLIVFAFAFPQRSNASGNKEETILVKTSAICKECKDRLETAMAYEKGVVKSSLNVETKVLTISYKPNKTTPEKIKQAISEAGYDADEVKANPKAYLKLPTCCKKE